MYDSLAMEVFVILCICVYVCDSHICHTSLSVLKLFTQQLFFFFLNLFGCAGSWVQHAGSSVTACGI